MIPMQYFRKIVGLLRAFELGYGEVKVKMPEKGYLFDFSIQRSREKIAFVDWTRQGICGRA